jgi:hypothetical protein
MRLLLEIPLKRTTESRVVGAPGGTTLGTTSAQMPSTNLGARHGARGLRSSKALKRRDIRGFGDQFLLKLGPRGDLLIGVAIYRCSRRSKARRPTAGAPHRGVITHVTDIRAIE